MFSTIHRHLYTLPDVHGDPLAEFWHYPDNHLLYVRWHGNLTSEEVIRVAAQYLHQQRQLHCPLLLNDKCDSTGDWREALEWLEYEWLPQARKLELKAFAYVFSPDVNNQLVSNEFLERLDGQLPVRVFYDLPTAWQWLVESPHD